MLYSFRLYIKRAEYILLVAPWAEESGDHEDPVFKNLLLIVPVENYEPAGFCFSNLTARLGDSFHDLHTDVLDAEQSRLQLRSTVLILKYGILKQKFW